MPPYRVLYYPAFSPDSRWLRQILLLTDDVTRIVPSDVEPDDSEDLLRLQEAIPGCLRRMAPGKSDVAIELEDRERLDRVFRQLSRRLHKRPKRITIEISPSGGISVAGHVFIHDSKVSEFVLELLTAHGLVEPFGNEISSGRFILVRKEASEVILAGVASRMARRIGIDTITDGPAPFAFGASRDLPSGAVNHGDVEGALLSALATLMVPSSVLKVAPARYREIRESYSDIRAAFKLITKELAVWNRLDRIQDFEKFADSIDSAALDFNREYREYRRTRFARAFKSWAPLCVGGVLSVTAALATPQIAARLATGAFAMQVIDRFLSNNKPTPGHRVFHMLAGIRRDIIKSSGVRELV